ncbi:DGQHR domain-containing protein [Rhodanobacter sp. UC4436_H3]
MSNTNHRSVLDEDFSIELPCVRVSQPIGDFYVASIDSAVLGQITYSDVRRLTEDREMDRYLGIQREVNPKRVKDIGQYVNTVDACFPTAVILAIPGRCADFDPDRRILTLHTSLDEDDEERRVNRLEIARVLDGQHRIEGLKALADGHPPFEINISVFVEMDIESQAYLFSVVNLAQTKVNKSLVYDLFEFSRARSPQKTCHQVAVALDTTVPSPLYQRIKRLGVATHGRFTETLTQATLVESLLPYLSDDPVKDRDMFLRGRVPSKVDMPELRRTIFRNMFLEERDLEIADVVFNFFKAVAERWPAAWSSSGDGMMLNKTNGFKACMRLLRPAYLHLTKPGSVVPSGAFLTLLRKSHLKDEDFNTDNFKPGTSGELALFRSLVNDLNLAAS